MIRKIKKQVETGAIVIALVVPLALCVFAFLSVAAYFGFRESLPPHLAALVTSACGVVLIALILLVAKIGSGGGSKAKRDGNADFELGEELESLMREHADPMLSNWVQNNPDRAAIATLALGIAAGYSSQFRGVLLDMYARYAESENLRRSGK